MGIFYHIVAFLVRITYWVVAQMLVLIGNLSKYKLFDDVDIISDFTNRVYIIIGVLMLFKLVISAIQYLVNPDSFGDKSKGAGALLQRTVISVALLVLVPSIFKFALEIQDTIVAAIPKIVFINDSRIPMKDGELDFVSSADKITYNIVSGFLVPKNSKEDAIGNQTNQTTFINDGIKIWDITEDIIGDTCRDYIHGNDCKYDLGFMLLSIPIGIYLVFLFGSMAVDIGIRTIKFGIVQLLAPIPIANYVTDEKRLNEWTKTSLQIYADLFIRLFVVYFVVEIIIMFLASFFNNNQFSGVEALMIKVAIIVALCIFAKNAPKFICDLLGIKGADESIGNMFKRASGMLGATASLPGRFSAARKNFRNEAAKAAGIDFNSDDWKNKTGAQRRQALKDAVKNYKPGKSWIGGRAAQNWRALKSAGSGYTRGMYESIAHNKGYKEAKSSARTSADKSYAISKELADKNVTRVQYYQAVHNQRQGIASSYTTSTEQAKGARAIADAAKSALDLAHNQLIEKNGGAQLTNEYVATLAGLGDSKFVDSLRSAVNFDIKDKNGASVFGVNINDVLQGGKYTLGDVQKTLQTIANDNTGKYDAMTQRRAQTQLDVFNGEVDKFIHGQEMIALSRDDKTAPGSGVKHNPALANIMQNAADTFGTYASSPFGQEMIQEGKRLGILDEKGNVKEGLQGVWYNMIKGKGLDEERKTKAGMGTAELAAMSAEELAKKFDNKKS